MSRASAGHARRLCLLGALAAAQTACAQEGGSDPDVVRPRFGWQPGMEARVVTEAEAFQRQPAEGDTTRERTVSTLRVVPHPEGMRIEWTDSGSAAAPAPAPQTGPAALAGVVVSDRGTFVRLEGAAEASAALRRGVRESLENARPELVGAMEEAVSEEALRAAAHAQWSLLVSRYAGREIALGEIHEERTVLPLGPGGPVRAIVEWAAEGRVPCAGEESEPRCVRFRVRTAADANDMARSYRAMRAAAAGPEPEMDALDFLMVHVSTEYVVAEEATLRPHRVEGETVLAIELGGDSVTSVERRVTRFTYTP